MNLLAGINICYNINCHHQQTPNTYRADGCPSCRRTNCVRALKGEQNDLNCIIVRACPGLFMNNSVMTVGDVTAWNMVTVTIAE